MSEKIKEESRVEEIHDLAASGILHDTKGQFSVGDGRAVSGGMFRTGLTPSMVSM